MRPYKSFFILTLILLGLLSTPFDTKAQDTLESSRDTTWKRGAIFNLSFSQVALKHWTGGGQNSISGTGVLNLFADYRKGNITWNNNLDMAYGLLSQQKGPFIKNDDEIELASQLGRRLQKDLFYNARIDLRSQFAPGYQFPEGDSVLISDFLSPGYGKGGLGISYAPSKHFDMSISPVATKVTVVNNDELAAQGAFGVEPGENVRYEFGGNLSASLSKEILKNVKLRSELAVFSNYLEEPGNIDINFSLLLNMKVNSFITASISTDMIYDDDIMVAVDTDGDDIPDESGPRLQLKEVLNIGISFDLGDTDG